jgi:3D (Asp-Asp-Asp) domain-containing protein
MMLRAVVPALLSVVSLGLAGCATAGSAWMAEPLAEGYEPPQGSNQRDFEDPNAGREPPRLRGRQTIVLGRGEPAADAARGAVESGSGGGVVFGGSNAPSSTQSGSTRGGVVDPGGGQSLGTFRNTYYDFPSESAFDGAKVALKGANCETIREVPRAFYESVCVQGSGRLASGRTVSFAKRNCACADVCPRTGEKICFEALDGAKFPFGRGATGRAITPLYTVAVDSDEIPLGTPLYVPELAGLPRGDDGSRHDGCFLAEDRGVRVRGKQVDVFTGDPSTTAVWNRLVPSNRGVTVIVGSSRCGARR